jgi:hypothetical protein
VGDGSAGRVYSGKTGRKVADARSVIVRWAAALALLQIAIARVRRRAYPRQLRRDAENRVDELALSNDIALSDPPNLTFESLED